VILYLTYDGLTDPLGQSQILPYLEGLAIKGYKVQIISFEKKDRFESGKLTIENRINKFENLTWNPLFYHLKPKIFSTIYDLYCLKRKSTEIIKKHDVKIVHCRSYPTSMIGLGLKRKLGVKFIFDMRGFYIDERFDGNIWNKNNLIWKNIYPRLKKLELNLINHADHVVSLTRNAVEEMKSWRDMTQENFSIIPCAANFNHFKTAYQKDTSEINLVYLGSIGTWYLLEEMLCFFKALNIKYPESNFHFITRDSSDKINAVAKSLDIDLKRILIYPSSRAELPSFLSKMDISIFFIKPCYSKKASSPTKLGELLGMGIPVICNTNIGDLEEQANENPNYIINVNLEENNYDQILNEIPDLIYKRQNEQTKIREVGLRYFSLYEGIERYNQIYSHFVKNISNLN
jgi:hypothetical protein